MKSGQLSADFRAFVDDNQVCFGVEVSRYDTNKLGPAKLGERDFTINKADFPSITVVQLKQKLAPLLPPTLKEGFACH